MFRSITRSIWKTSATQLDAFAETVRQSSFLFDNHILDRHAHLNLVFFRHFSTLATSYIDNCKIRAINTRTHLRDRSKRREKKRWILGINIIIVLLERIVS